MSPALYNLCLFDCDSNTEPDLNEMLRIVREHLADHPAVKAGFPYHGPNSWPNDELLLDGSQRCSSISMPWRRWAQKCSPFMPERWIFPDYFNGLFDDPVWTTRNQHYIRYSQ